MCSSSAFCHIRARYFIHVPYHDWNGPPVALISLARCDGCKKCMHKHAGPVHRLYEAFFCFSPPFFSTEVLQFLPRHIELQGGFRWSMKSQGYTRFNILAWIGMRVNTFIIKEQGQRICYRRGGMLHVRAMRDWSLGEHACKKMYEDCTTYMMIQGVWRLH